MKADVLKAYIKYIYKGLLVQLVIFSIFFYFNGGLEIYLVSLVIYLIGGYFKYETRLIEMEKLKAKGLTEVDIINIQFVKKWAEAREGGIWKYCITDGGIILGAYLWLIIGILAIATSVVKLKTLVDDPGNMFSFIGYSYMTGAIIGVIINRLLWIHNQRRFLKLTDPLNDKYQQKLFQDYN